MIQQRKEIRCEKLLFQKSHSVAWYFSSGTRRCDDPVRAFSLELRNESCYRGDIFRGIRHGFRVLSCFRYSFLYSLFQDRDLLYLLQKGA